MNRMIAEQPERIRVETLFNTVELQRRAVREGYQWRLITRDRHGVIVDIGEWAGPYTLLTPC